MRRIIIAVVAATYVVVAGSFTATAQVADRDCSDFNFQEDAQVAHEQHPEWQLDADGDGVACEDLPHRGEVTTPTTTLGEEVLPLTGASSLPLVGGAGLVVIIGVVVLVATRYRPRHARRIG